MNTQSTNAYYKSGNSNVVPPTVFTTDLKSGVDFIYEYSDLNFLQTRVKVLTGDYAGLILDYGGSYIVRWVDKNEFSFEYTIYAAPEKLFYMDESEAEKLKVFLTDLLCAVIDAKKNDPDEAKKTMEALVKEKSLVGSIKIDSKFYNR